MERDSLKNKINPPDIVLYVIIGVVVFYLILSLIPEKEPEHQESRPWKEILTPEQMGKHSSESSHKTYSPIQSGSSENQLIEQLSKSDYNDHSDYNGGLDGEHSDIDFAEVDEYFKD